MSPFKRHPWFIAAAGITLAYGLVSLFSHESSSLTAFSDIVGLLIMLLPASIMLVNALTRPSEERSFWVPMSLGFFLWACNQAAWAYCEIVQKHPIPDPYFFDIVLFFHVVPMIGAVAWRPDLLKRTTRIHLSALNFLMLLGWWSALYAFLVFPHQYVVLNVPVYDTYYDGLYLLENGLFLIVLALSAFTSSRGWKRLYLNFLAAETVYCVGSRVVNRALSNHTYYSGSLYDVPLVGAVLWMAASAISTRGWELRPTEFRLNPRWKRVVPNLAMLAILSLPLFGLWAVWLDSSPAPTRAFRIYAVLAGMLLLGSFIFLRQYVQDQALISLLQESRRAFDSQEKLQTQLVQKEKLASLGTLVAGAAEEIDHPLTTIMNDSERLWSHEGLTEEQKSLVRKIANHARRSRDLVANLLQFAQHAPGEKAQVDVAALLNRARQMAEWRFSGGKSQVALSVEADLPKVWGNVNQLFQTFVEIIENAMDALQECGGGLLEIKAQSQGNEVVLEFSDTGPGVRDPLRVFDPFYTTKPVGKGTGLGLSVVYGVVQDHGGQITCSNKPAGGAVFTLRLAITPEHAARVVGAGGN
ncbi:MAG TPA: HAMP domain-containing sensor histidine kinase [Candidatus Sulfotelmatobacter sp.]|nr:HAMP domain-containing sensor histidine kinase [Candidatus Sulfotelmatobacter sp.]